MANIFELNINLNEMGKSEAEEALDETTNGASASSSDKKEKKELTNLEKTGKMLAGIHLASKIDSNILRPLANLGTSTVGTIYGDTARMNQINNLTNSINTGMGFVNSGLSGYAIGKSVSGTSGAGVAMAIVNVVLDVAGEAINMIENSIQYNNQQLDHKYNAIYASERLGLLAVNKGR